MKRKGLLSISMLLLVLPQLLFAAGDSPWEKELPFESAVIQYAITGMEEGEETVYIRDSGREMATYHKTVSKMMGMSIENSTIELKDPDYIYSYDLQTREGTKVTNPEKYMIEEYEKLSSADKKKVNKNAEESGTVFMEGMQGAFEQNSGDVLGYSCDRAEPMPGAVSYMMHGTGILLKSSVDMMGMKMNIVATSLDKGKVSDRFFKHPEGITAQLDENADSMTRAMAKNVIAMLVDPESAKHSQGPSMSAPSMQGMSEEEKKMLEDAQKMMQQMQGALKQ